MMSMDLDVFGLAAITTPLVDAPASLEVLVDALLETRILPRYFPRVPPRDCRPNYAELTSPGGTGVLLDRQWMRIHSARDQLRIDAVEWARDRLMPHDIGRAHPGTGLSDDGLIYTTYVSQDRSGKWSVGCVEGSVEAPGRST